MVKDTQGTPYQNGVLNSSLPDPSMQLATITHIAFVGELLWVIAGTLSSKVDGIKLPYPNENSLKG